MTILYLYILVQAIFSQTLQVNSGTNFHLSGVQMKINDLNLSGSFTQDNSSTLTLEGNWTNNNDLYFANDGNTYFSSSFSQTITNSNTENFNNLTISKSSGTIFLANSSSITIDGNLDFNSDTEGIIYSRDNALVSVSSGNIARTNQGFVDGPMAINFGTGDISNTTFTIGNGNDYTPVEIDIDGVGGTGGYLQFTSNDRTLDMIGSQLDADLNVERQYEGLILPTSGFDLGASRSFNMVIHYLNPEDIRNGANSNTFETARYDGPLWASGIMETGTRTINSVQSINNTQFGTFVVGPEDFFIEMYTRSSGSFNDPANWSLYGYGGAQSSFAPRSRDIPFIGDGDEINLFNDISILSQRTLTVELAGPSNSSGTFLMADNILGGSGTFTLNSGGYLGIGEVNGIVNSPTLLGNIQTFERNYNPANHNNGNFIFTSNSSATVGNGFPADIANMYVETSDDLFLLQNTNISNDLVISTGNLDLQEFDIAGSPTGTFTILADASLNIGGTNNLLTSLDGFGEYNIDIFSNIEFNGSNQTVSIFPTNFDTSLGFGNLILNNTGTKLVNLNTRVRNNATIIGNAFLQNEANVTNFSINGNLLNNNSGLINYGRIRLGQ